MQINRALGIYRRLLTSSFFVDTLTSEKFYTERPNIYTVKGRFFECEKKAYLRILHGVIAIVGLAV